MRPIRRYLVVALIGSATLAGCVGPGVDPPAQGGGGGGLGGAGGAAGSGGSGGGTGGSGGSVGMDAGVMDSGADSDAGALDGSDNDAGS